MQSSWIRERPLYWIKWKMVRGRRNVPRKRRRGNLFIYSSELGAAAVGALESDLLAEMISPSLSFASTLAHIYKTTYTRELTRSRIITSPLNTYVFLRCTEFAMRDAALFELLVSSAAAPRFLRDVVSCVDWERKTALWLSPSPHIDAQAWRLFICAS